MELKENPNKLFKSIQEICAQKERWLGNLILKTDSYKITQWPQYPDKTEYITSYVEARGGDWTLWIGFQILAINFLSQQLTAEMVDDAKDFCDAHIRPGIFNYDGFMRIVNEFDGYWPVEICAVPEGMVIPKKNVLLTITNTHPDFAWVVSFLETVILRAVWYPTTVASKSFETRRDIWDALNISCDTPEEAIAFMLLDFGARGGSSGETVQIGGLAHLATGFLGTDSMEGVLAMNTYYGADMAGFSVFATEHSTMTSWEKSGEFKAVQNALLKGGFGINIVDGEAVASGHFVSIVTDSYSHYNCVGEYIGTRLNKEVRALGKIGGRLVVRPDSGEICEVMVRTLDILTNKFADDIAVNDKGFIVLPPYLRVLFADGINGQDIRDAIAAILKAGYSIENVLFGMGGGLLQGVTRDDKGFAMKCCSAVVGGVKRDVYKDPEGAAFKKSKKGLWKTVITVGGEILSHEETSILKTPNTDLLIPVFRNGEVLRLWTCEEVRENAALFLNVA